MEECYEKKHIRSEVLNIALPVLVELFLGSLFGMVDMMMLGRIENSKIAAASIASVGITNQPLFIGLSLVQALNVGGTAMVARYIGSRKNDRIESVVKHVVLLNLILLVLPIFIIGIFFTEDIMSLLGAQQDAIMVGKNYFKVIMVGFIFQAFNLSIAAVLRGAGNTKTPMKINLRVNLINVVGNAVLIYGLLGFPKLGVVGAGISTCISHIVASIFLARHVLKKDDLIKVSLKTPLKYDKNIIYNLIKIGVPASLEQVAFRIGILLYVRMVASLGTVVYATHQICLNILSLTFTPGQAFGIAASSLVGKSLGADDLEGAEEYIKESRKIGSIISSTVAVIFFFFGGKIVGLYTKNPEIINEASTVLKIIAFVQPFQSSQLIIAGGLRGAGDTVWTLVATFLGVMVLRVILAYLFVRVLGMGLVGAWIATFVDQFVRWIVIYLRFRTNKWKYITIR
ncbi:MATE family efflux transporter [Anaerosalibacter sp. Marseille-P3206]|uniref:MATE family efflux transporter n=1 Tax=Anaerosalibacter sp. Marseille-P3206 TaxID=1871005 RepID=UPI000985B2DE|nr:MATE family efflux transporter [Anaerosalibacter sp. Marseille-P3206]